MDKSLKRTIMASIIGTVLEWYDYVLYGTASALIFDKVFFPNFSGAFGTLMAFATFAVGFIIRPLGGIIFGTLGDKIGRKRVLMITIVLMGSATTLMGVLPTFDSIGYWAPILLVLLRALQGIGSGSEYAGAVITMAENAPVKRRGLYSSLPYVGVSIGLMLSSSLFGLMEKLPHSSFMAWGWRIPFLLSTLLVIFGLIIRSGMKETPVFESLKKEHKQVKLPLVTAFRTAPKEIVIAWLISLTDTSFSYLYQTFLVAYVVNTLSMPESLTLTTLSILGIVQLFTIPFFGALSDKVGRRWVLIGGTLTSAIFGFPLFWILNTKIPFLIVLSIILASSVFRGAIVAAQASWFTELFNSKIRYTGFAVGREWPTVLAGLMPSFGSAVLIWSNNSTWGISLLIVVFSLLAFVAALVGPENSKLDLGEIENKPTYRERQTNLPS
ncbi:MFS transporter [Pullulanibacillus camelliae]|uniref:Putative proline/betaine transporter n=1 Tax=Pullulanibacillus camelliae TaxID=1707096 RepID=A0A8J2YKZ5_9BACL|nr:MFS transporter [Pullulanibacillus camelliae]GGE49756.1 MFS transporter [Pullulanibacillus camelliae]